MTSAPAEEEAIVKCPVCKDVTLLMSEKNGVEIDYCPECRGIWLDRGELDKIVDRARSARDGWDDGRGDGGDGRRGHDRHDDGDRDWDRREHDRRRHKKKSPVSALGDILEIFGGEE